MSEGWERLGRRRGGRGGCLLGACLDTTVLSRSPILALFLPFQNGKDQSFHSRNGHRTERSCFYQTELSKEGWFVVSFLFPFTYGALFVSFHLSGGKEYVTHHGSKNCCYERLIEGGRMDG